MNVKRAVIGEIAMIPQIENVHLAITIGKIPESWKGKSYASLKPLGSYINDLMARLQFLQTWIDIGEPTVYWFSGFYFTQSFITGILQNHSRKHKLQIDLVTIQFNVTEFESEARESNDVGVFVRVSRFGKSIWILQSKIYFYFRAAKDKKSLNEDFVSFDVSFYLNDLIFYKTI